MNPLEEAGYGAGLANYFVSEATLPRAGIAQKRLERLVVGSERPNRSALPPSPPSVSR